MPKITVTVDSSVEAFYAKIAESAALPIEQVLSDALFKLAGELSLESLSKAGEK